MQIETRNGAAEESRIVAGVITDDAVCAVVAAAWDPADGGPFASKWANLAGRWAVEYHREYGKAPGNAIAALYETWASGPHADAPTAELMARFMGQLSDGHATAAPLAADYLIDVAGRLFNRVRCARLRDTLTTHLAANAVDDAVGAVQGYKRVELGQGCGVDMFLDRAASRAAYADGLEPLFAYPGPLGKLFGTAFSRDCFVGLTGVMGTGKTWWCGDFALQAMLPRNRVAFFLIGDMSQGQMYRRFHIRCAGLPSITKPYKYPTSLTREKGQFYATATHEEFQAEAPITEEQGWAAFEKYQKKKLKSNDSYFKLSCHPSLSITIYDLIGIINGWEMQGWIPDVIIIDYPDNLAPPPGVKDKREQINVTWQNLRGLSQRLHACVVAATQSDADGYEAVLLKRKNFSDARYKNDCVSHMFNINQTPGEKAQGIYRLNCSKFRDGYFDERRCWHVASCLALGNPAVLSCF